MKQLYTFRSYHSTNGDKAEAPMLHWHLHIICTYPSLSLMTIAHLCRSYVPFRGDRHNCISPRFSVLCKLWLEMVFFDIAPDSVHPSQSGPSSMSLPSYLHRCYLLCNILVFSSHYMAIPWKAFGGDMWWLHRSWSFHFWFGLSLSCLEPILAF